MRKLSTLFFCAIYIALYPRPVEVYKLPLPRSAQVLFYADEAPDSDAVFNGINYEIKTNFKQAKEIGKKVKPKYVTVIFDGNMDYVKRYLKLQNAESIAVAGGELVSGYCHFLKSRRTEEGFNVQVFHKNGKIYIGCPSIFGSY